MKIILIIFFLGNSMFAIAQGKWSYQQRLELFNQGKIPNPDECGRQIYNNLYGEPCEEEITGGGYEPIYVNENVGDDKQVLKQINLSFERDLETHNGIHIVKFPFNYDLDGSANNYLTEQESGSNCAEFENSELVEEFNRPTHKFFRFLDNEKLNKKTEHEVTVVDKKNIKVEIANQVEHNIKKSEIFAKFKHYKKTKKIPIIEIEVDECHEYIFDYYYADLKKTTSDESYWINENQDMRYKVSGNMEYETNKKNIAINYDYVNAKDNTLITIECEMPECYSPWKKVLNLDLKDEKKKYDDLIALEKAEAERARLKMEEEARKEAKRLKEQEIEWEKYKQKMLEQTKIEEEKERKREQERVMREIKSTPYSQLSDAQQKEKIKLLKKECESIGFIRGSDDFKNCIVELMN